MENDSFFNDIDGLVLATIASNSNDDILSWIGFIDFYYRIILTYEELHNSLSKLQKSGLIVYEEKELCCTERANKLLAGRNRMGVLNWIFKVQERIIAFPFEDSYNVRFTILKAEYENQLKVYYSRVRKTNKE